MWCTEQKEVDKNNGDGNSAVVYCCDTEALLISPRNNSNDMYYRTKLNIYNHVLRSENPRGP